MKCRIAVILTVVYVSMSISSAPETHAAPVAWQASWPMVGHDARRTNRSAATVPSRLSLLFSRTGVFGQPAIGPDGTIYAWTSKGLSAIGASGHARWNFAARMYEGGPPVLAPDGTLYANGFTSRTISPETAAILGISSRGVLTEKVQPAAFAKGVAPAETPSGELYVPYVGPTEEHAGLVVQANGRRRFLQPGFAFYSFAVGRTGSIYAVGRYSSHEDRLSVERLGPGGTVAWRHPLKYDGASVLVGRHGMVYVADGVAAGQSLPASTQISAYNSHGRLQWRRGTKNGTVTLAQRGDRDILAAGQTYLAAYSPADGTLLWKTQLGRSTLDAVPSIAVDGAGTAFVGSGDGVVRIVSADGKLLGKIAAGKPSTTATPEVAISADGRLAVVGADDTLREYR